MIETPRLNLIPADAGVLEAVLGGNAMLSRVLGVNVPRGWTQFKEVFPEMLKAVKKDISLENWGCYLIVHREDNLLVGSCGFKGQPSPEGTVEIGYEIKATYREKGLATEVANALVAFAQADARVRVVLAHTLPERNASCVVLEKSGFVHTGEVNDPEDGTVWRWEKPILKIP